MESANRQQGRKKLVPAMNREQACPHTYQEEDELRLEIDCSSCPGAQDIRNRRCMSGMIHILSSEAVPNTIILKRHIHKRYREPALQRAFYAAGQLSVLNRAVANPDVASDTRCQTCRASTPRTAARLRQALLDDPMGYIDSLPALTARLRSDIEGACCANGEKCLEQVTALAWHSQASG
jgi:50S ribosomal subunit-associated GTPase HflX